MLSSADDPGCCQTGCGDGVLALVLENLMCQYFSCMFCSQLARVKTTEQVPKQNSQLGKKSLLALLSWSEVSPPALGHVSKCQDATDWIEAEDFPFLWFFCLF